MAPDSPSFAAAPKATIAPNGQRLGTLVDSSGPRTRNRLEYHNGQIMPGSSNIYVIWYGNWTQSDTTGMKVLMDFMVSIGGSSYFRTVTQYANASGQTPTGGLVYGGAVEDLYSQGAALTRANVETIVTQQINNYMLPHDPRGIYVVLVTPDIMVTDLVQPTCAYRQHVMLNGSPIKYAVILNPQRMPSLCAPQMVGPNGTMGADGMASLLAAELANSITDPVSNAWFDKLGYELADKCAWNFGTTYTAANGARANVRLGARDYLLQQLWSPTKQSGKCVIASP